MSSQHAFSATKPISAWNKPLKANFKDLFKSLGKAVIDGTTGNWGNAAKDLGDAAVSVGLKEDIAQIAWQLVYNAIAQAVYTLIDEHRENFLDPPSAEAMEMLCDDLDWTLEQSELCIDRSLFERPKELAVVEAMKTPFSQWLTKGFGLNDARAQSMTSRLPSYFVFALNAQWRESPQRYGILKEAVETPFTTASLREQGWLYYRAWLQKQVDEQVFGETFSLKQVYIPLRAYYKKKKEKSDDHDKHRTERIVIDLEQALIQWLRDKKEDDALRVICGGPGCGKSSFARMFAAHLAERSDLPVLFIPLYQLELADDIIEAVGSFVQYEPFFSENPLNKDTHKGEARLLVIFDGLDELAMQGKVGQENAQYFIREVQRQLSSFNRHTTRLQVLISGRDAAIPDEREFHKPGQILHVLPYFLKEEEQKDYTDPQKRLPADQRQQWWQNYGNVSGKGYTEMPEALSQPTLDEITTQPLLNYLVALSYTRGKITFSQATNLNEIYADLLQAVYARGWASHRHAAVEDLSEDLFIRVLEEIAVAAWHGEGRVTTVREVQEHCEQSGLTPLLDTFTQGVKQGLSRLFLAFYFRQSGRRQGGDETFEFTHKSFGEYLTARRIVRGVRRMHDELQRRQETFDSGMDERDALIFWAKLCGPTRMETYLFDFICDEMRLQPESVLGWQYTLCHLIGIMLKTGMPMEALQLKSYRQEATWALHAEEALLAVLNSCARCTQERSTIAWPSETSFGEWIGRLQGQRRGDENVLAFHCLSYLDIIVGSVLFGRDFCWANFSHTSLSDTTLSHAILFDTDLTCAVLTSANLNRADLTCATLRDATLRDATLHGADLRSADLHGANLSRTDLTGATLHNANLSGATLSHAILHAADLHGANLRDANLRDANLSEATLSGATISGADLSHADLNGVTWIDGKKYSLEQLSSLIEELKHETENNK